VYHILHKKSMNLLHFRHIWPLWPGRIKWKTAREPDKLLQKIVFAEIFW